MRDVARTPHIGVVAGEHSGDLIGAAIIRALRAEIPNLRCSGVGGPRMVEAGLELLAPASSLSMMGLWQPLKHLPQLWRLRRRLRDHYARCIPDLFLGIDAPDFNLGLERSLRSIGIHAVHCVSPSIWAWRSWRIKKVHKSVNLMLTLFPFEADFYREHKVPVHHIGHPLADVLAPVKDYRSVRTSLGLPPKAPIIGLLPGSRSGEIKKLATLFFQTAKLCLHKNPEMHFPVAVSDKRFLPYLQSQLEQVAKDDARFLTRVHFNSVSSHQVIIASDVVLTASGTASLEILLLDKPMVISYRIDWLTYVLVKMLSKIKVYGLPNLLTGEYLVPELFQADATPTALAQTALQQLNQPKDERAQLLAKYAAVRSILKRDAATTAARYLLKTLTRTAPTNSPAK